MSDSPRRAPATRPQPLWRREAFLGVTLAACLLFLVGGEAIFAGLSNPLWLAFVAASLFTVILISALAVVRHAEAIAERVGEPYGTLILTLSVTSIEVMSLSAVMLHGQNNPTLVRDTLFSVVMIILGGMVGLSLLIGAWRHREQLYNLQGANVYLGLIIPLAVLSLVMPDYTRTTAGPTLSVAQETFLIVMSVGLYGAFLAMQTRRYRGYFVLAGAEAPAAAAEGHHGGGGSAWGHAALLAAYMVPVVFLAEQLARPLDYAIETLHAPTALGGFVIALVVAAPEGVGAARAALVNDVQRAVNIFLGSVLCTIGLTVPAMLIVSLVTGRGLVLGLEHTDFVMLLLTLAVSVVTFASGRTNVMQGAVHLLLFLAYLLLMFQG